MKRRPIQPAAPLPENLEAVKTLLFTLRQRARTDLLWLCNDVLQYKDVCAEVHGPIIDKLQKFPGGVDYITDRGEIAYKPHNDDPKSKVSPVWHLQGPRKRLFLDPRGHLKTTVITIAHSIQWIINFPDIRILLSMATGDQVTRVMQEILFHFRFNEKFRWLFSDFCPNARTAKDFGNNECFTVPARRRKWMKEPTVSTCSVGKVVASGHYEVIKNSDLVDKENVKTPSQIADVVSHFRYLNPLLERGPIAPHHGWTDVEGTRYDFADLYGQIMDDEDKAKPEDKIWQVSLRAAVKEDGNPLWPERFPHSELQQIERDMGPYIYAGQYLQKPIPVGSGLATKEEITFVPERILGGIPMVLHMTVDLAGMDPQSNGDYTAICTAGFDRDGRMNVLDQRCSRYDPFEVIEILFLLNEKFKGVLDIKIEKDAHMRVLGPFLQREQMKRKFLPPIVPIKRDNRTSKKQRIKGLQPWFKAGIIRFSDAIGCKTELIQQITRFSDTSTYHDDILDTLTDQMQNRDGGIIADVMPDAPRGQSELGMAPLGVRGRFLGFGPYDHGPMWEGDSENISQYVQEMTGL